MPLINNLKNPALRHRHWGELKDLLGSADFNPNDVTFTLETINKLELHKYAEQIENISSTANKEQSIEKAMVEISGIWEDLKLDMGKYKEEYHVLLGTEELMQFLEDHQVQLSTMRNSPYFKTFADEINGW